MAADVVHLGKRRSDGRSSVLLDFRDADQSLMRDEAFSNAVLQQDAVFMAADFVRKARQKAGLTQVELAKRLHVSQARVSVMESGSAKQGPSIAVLSKVARACGVTLRLSIDVPHMNEEANSPKICNGR